MKPLRHHAFNAASCRAEWTEFSNLLNSKTVLSERKDILPFFRKRDDLSLLICNYFPKFSRPDTLHHEYQIYGDFVADLVVGDSSVQHYLLVEFENGAPDSVFKRSGKKGTPVWSSRFEGAYSQLTDWLWKLEDMRSTSDFQSTFGSRRASFQGLIVIGKDMGLSSQEQDRLDWRLRRTMIDSNAIDCVSFNDLRDDLDHWLRVFHRV
jgi:hypothetical protein